MEWRHFDLYFRKYGFHKRTKTICQMNAFGLVFDLIYSFIFCENRTFQNLSLTDAIVFFFINFAL